MPDLHILSRNFNIYHLWCVNLQNKVNVLDFPQNFRLEKKHRFVVKWISVRFCNFSLFLNTVTHGVPFFDFPPMGTAIDCIDKCRDSF